MWNRKYIGMIVCMCWLWQLQGQQFYYVDTLVVFGDARVIETGIFDIQSCDKDTIFSTGNFHAFDIVRTPTDSFFLYTSDRKDTLAGLRMRYYNLQYNYVRHMGDFSNNQFIRALTVDATGTVYAAGTGLSLYHPGTNTYEFIGDLPPDMQAGGDLMFYKGELYLTTINNTLVRVDINNPLNSTVAMTFPPGTQLIDGLAVYPYHCENIEVYAIGQGAEGSKIYQLDMENQTLTLVCQTPYHFWGATTDIEWQIPKCFNLDLDENDSSLLPGNDFRTDTFCLAPATIVDDDVHIRIEGRVDSIIVQLAQLGNPGQEFLQATNIAGIQILGNNSTELKFINEGDTDAATFEAALKQLLYVNNASNVVFGSRMATFLMYQGAEVSAPAQTIINLDGNALDYTINAKDISCMGQTDGQATLVAPNNYTVSWEDGSANGVRNDLGPGLHRFSVANSGGCQKEDSLFINEPTALSLSIQADWDTICQNEGRLLATVSGGTPDYTYAWSAASTTAELADIPAGSYSLEVQDANNCRVSASYTLMEGDEVTTRQEHFLCPEEIFNLAGQNMVISQDTTICQTFITNTGCDSTHCYDLRLIPASLEMPTELSLSFGDSIQVEPMLNFAPQSVIWSPEIGVDCSNCLSVYLRPEQTTTYQIEVVSPDGCLLSQELLVNVDIQNEVYIPNVFSPNGDGVNDTFNLLAPGSSHTIQSIRIFNRWGQLVYEGYDQKPGDGSGWDGMDLQNRLVPKGIYIYQIEVVLPAGKREVIMGDVTILR